MPGWPPPTWSVGVRLKKAMETRVVSSMAREVAYTLTMESANFITQDTSRPLQGVGDRRARGIDGGPGVRAFAQGLLQLLECVGRNSSSVRCLL